MTARFELIEDPVLISLLKEHVSPKISFIPKRFDKVINSSSYPPNLYRLMSGGGRDIIWIKHNGRVEVKG